MLPKTKLLVASKGLSQRAATTLVMMLTWRNVDSTALTCGTGTYYVCKNKYAWEGEGKVRGEGGMKGDGRM